MTQTVRAKAVAAFSVAALGLLFSGAFAPLRSAELLMFEHAGCPWCLRWHREIGPIYPRTEESKRAPLRRIAFPQKLPADVSFAEPVVATPTFVLVENKKEIGRITGYTDEATFWGLLGTLLQKLPRAERGVL